jgi:hypothetical protein
MKANIPTFWMLNPICSATQDAMRLFIRYGCALLAAGLLLVGCSRSAGRAQAPATHTKPPATRLTQGEVIRIASQAAEKHGYRLADYKEPQVHYEFTRKDKTWTIFYDGRIAMPGHHFGVWVGDQTGETRVIPGK